MAKRLRPFVFVAFLLLVGLIPAVLPAEELQGSSAVRIDPALLDQVRIELSEPVVVAASQPGERRWGYYQFPKVSPLPSGSILLTFNATPDDNLAFGEPSPAYVSRDSGKTWRPYEGPDKMLTVPSSPIIALASGEFLITPYPKGMNLHGMAGMPKPVGKYFCYFDRLLYELKACPEQVRKYMSAMPAWRWTSETRAWRPETVRYDLNDALVETSESAKGTSSISRPSLEWLPAEKEGVLYYPDFSFHYKLRDGAIPRQLIVHCMVSTDGGHTWQRRGEIATDPTSADAVNEAVIAPTTRGDLVCVLRSTDQKLRPMYVSFSQDGGWNWSPRQRLFDFGVMPHAVRMRDGLIVLTFGRPGVYMSLSIDGSGRNWTPPIPLRPGDRTAKAKHSCGYTSLLKLSDTELLVTYSDFQYRDAQGDQHKAILVRKVGFPR